MTDRYDRLRLALRTLTMENFKQPQDIDEARRQRDLLADWTELCTPSLIGKLLSERDYLAAKATGEPQA